MDGVTADFMDISVFPIETSTIADYEKMLASSRLGVFATGFHFGWRNIVTLAMMVGLPIYCDHFLITHRQNYEGYTLFKNEPGDWRIIEELLLTYRDADRLLETKRSNQRFFDRHLSPEVVAGNLIADTLGYDRPRSERDEDRAIQCHGNTA